MVSSSSSGNARSAELMEVLNGDTSLSNLFLAIHQHTAHSNNNNNNNSINNDGRNKITSSSSSAAQPLPNNNLSHSHADSVANNTIQPAQPPAETSSSPTRPNPNLRPPTSPSMSYLLSEHDLSLLDCSDLTNLMLLPTSPNNLTAKSYPSLTCKPPRRVESDSKSGANNNTNNVSESGGRNGKRKCKQSSASNKRSGEVEATTLKQGLFASVMAKARPNGIS